MVELSKQFRFDAAHTLEREISAASSRRVHGHSYRGEVTIRGEVDPVTGMVLDLGQFEQMLEETRAALDHHFLNDVKGLGPGTLENLAIWIWQSLAERLPGLFAVTVYRDSGGETCRYFGPDAV